MFRFIHWGQYFTTILVLATMYWLVIAAIYFRRDFLQWLQSKKIAISADSAAEQATTEDLFTTVSALKLGLQAVLEQGAEKRWIKEELLLALRRTLQPYDAVKGTAFQVAINNYITAESQSLCGVEITDMEIQQLWNNTTPFKRSAGESVVQ